MNSILQNKRECFKCHNTERLELHHIFFGNSNRKLSEKDGLKVYLCVEHHRGTYGVHGKNGNDFNLYLKEIGQKAWQKYYNKTKEDFIARYGKSYI